MGDVMTLIEKAEEGLDSAESQRLAETDGPTVNSRWRTCATSCDSCGEWGLLSQVHLDAASNRSGRSQAVSIRRA